ncbi:hypothetical protein AB751O23_AO_00090 [Chlamydiales bacterium SCGC AB-751-O23]|jgi:broad specificity phosphatase PhoE|nr:hypothetical protein AB751O23_AO_00090 [Chlamydiales bacterium SCGC AB-751-O23]
MKIIAIRHAKTSWNEKKLLQGRKDISIIYPDAKDLKRLKSNKEKLDLEKGHTHIFTSQLKRTRETALLHGFSFKDLQVSDLLNEIDFGDIWEGKDRESIDDVWKEALTYPDREVFAESISSFTDRIKDFVSQVESLDKILVFGHGLWMRALLSLLEHGSVEYMNQYLVDNNSYHEMDVSLSKLQKR